MMILKSLYNIFKVTIIIILSKISQFNTIVNFKYFIRKQIWINQIIINFLNFLNLLF